MDYAMTQNNLGNAYSTLAEVEDKASNCSKAIAAYREALKVYTLEDFPMDYATTQNNLGTAYRTLAEVEDKASNCNKAIAAYREALKVYTEEKFPEVYRIVERNLKRLLDFCKDQQNEGYTIDPAT
jgi:tetratricopeptide (TPR) repeat protein